MQLDSAARVFTTVLQGLLCSRGAEYKETSHGSIKKFNGIWENTFEDLDLYLMHVISYLQETNDMRESSFFQSAESLEDILQPFVFHLSFIVRIQISKDLYLVKLPLNCNRRHREILAVQNSGKLISIVALHKFVLC